MGTGYNREAAVAYAHKWALKRNPRYYNFTGIGGDCANFASQCLYAGGKIMNYRPIYGWYYVNANNRAPAWSSVKYLHQFLVNNKETGPYGSEVALEEVQPGDLIQLSTMQADYHHTLIVVKVGDPPSPENILICAHTYDSDNRALDTYAIRKIRCIHIEGVRS